MADVIKVEGIKTLQQKLKLLEDGSQKKLRLVMNVAAEIVAQGARNLAPVKTGDFKASIRAASQQRYAVVAEGNNTNVKYAGAMDFGGNYGPQKSHHRAFFKEGRYLWPSVAHHRPEIQAVLEIELNKLIREVGLE